MKKFALLLMVFLLTATFATANDIDQKWGLGANFGLMKLVGGQHDYSNLDQNFGLWMRHGLSSKWSFEAAFRAGYVRPGSAQPGEDAGLSLDSTHAFYTTILHGTLGARYHFSPDNSFSPYAGFHAGFIDWNVRDETGNNDVKFMPDGDTVYGYADTGRTNYLSSSSPTIGASLGMEYFFSDAISMDLAARYSYLIDNDLDNIGTSAMWGAGQEDVNNGLLEFFLGLTVYFGGDKDKDDDGILNADDACPEVAEDMDGYQDEDGCPELDNDGDGIADADDQCPDQAEDMDGFQDADGCPDTDNDGDGVLDAQDNCPDEAEDIDGYMDQDGCPDPDNDGDGVLDAQDNCPDTPAGVLVDANGCPVVEEIVGSIVLDDVYFELSSDQLKTESYAILDKLVEGLKAYPGIEVEIQGHTDSSGAAEFNLNLSGKRAESVKNYLVNSGIDASRLTAVGYGEENPILPNDTREGRAANRRVELLRTDTN